MLDTIREGWDRAALEDPMFYILTSEDKKNRGWDPDEFFQRGRDQIAQALERVGDDLNDRERALDFGCGLGRCTQALAEHFDRVDGCDVSAEMVHLAGQMNEQGGQVQYFVNDQTLPFPNSRYDFVYTIIVLQHMPPGMAVGYIREFARVLKPGGVMMFQLPEGPDCPHTGHPFLSMWSTPRPKVEGWVEGIGCEVLAVEPSSASGDDHQGWEYTARKGKP